jgi:hypothetical protein
MNKDSTSEDSTMFTVSLVFGGAAVLLILLIVLVKYTKLKWKPVQQKSKAR